MGVQLARWQQSRKLAVIVVTVALTLDAVLITVIVPMLPDIMKRLQASEKTSNASHSVTDLLVNSSITDLQPAFSEHRSSVAVLQPAHIEYVNSSADLWPDTQHANLTSPPNPDDNTDAGHLTTKIGLLLASKMFFEIIGAPLFGLMADRMGYTVPMLAGFVITFVSTMLFAFADSYELMFVARSAQGLGSAAIFAPGFGLLADMYQDEQERAQAVSIAFGGIFLGALIGPVYGGLMYQLYGKTISFSILAFIVLVDGVLRFCITAPQRKLKEASPSMKELLSDPYILLVSGGIFFVNFGYTMLEPLLPAWMMDTMHANSAQQGLAFMPMIVTMLVSLNWVGRLSLRIQPRWMAIWGLVIVGVGMILIPVATSQIQLIIPTAMVGLGLAFGDCSLLPYLAHLVDLRHKSVYGMVYAISHMVYCFSYLIGGILGGPLQASIGFAGTLTCVGVVSILYTPFLFFLRIPGTREEENPLRERIV